jgi:hypothetical protein
VYAFSIVVAVFDTSEDTLDMLRVFLEHKRVRRGDGVPHLMAPTTTTPSPAAGWRI